MPSCMLAGVIWSTVKNNQGNIKRSYREVMISSNFFELLKYLVPYIKCVVLCPAQFCYRSNTSTMLERTLIKTVESNIVRKSMFLHVFLNHNILFYKIVPKTYARFYGIQIFKLNIFLENNTAQVNFNDQFIPK